jgi:hypothetical protein
MGHHTLIMWGSGAGTYAKAAKQGFKNHNMQNQKAAALNAKSTPPAKAPAKAPAIPTTLAQADMVAVAHAAHGLGTAIAAYHGGQCPVVAKTQVPAMAAAMVRTYVAKYGATAVVTPTGIPTTWGSKGKPGGKRHTIVQAILAGGSLTKVWAISRANGASYGGLADLVVAIWQGVVTLSHK